MRLILFSDLHADAAAARRLAAAALGANVSAIVSAGDTADDGVHVDAIYAAFRHAGVPVLAVPGNHDRADGYLSAVYAGGWEDLHERVRVVEGWSLAGFGSPVHEDRYAGPDPEAQSEDPDLTAFLSRLDSIDPRRLIVVTHLPPFGTLAARDRRLIDRGSVQLRRWLEDHQPAAALCGHVHLREVAVDRVGETLVVNAGLHGWVGDF